MFTVGETVGMVGECMDVASCVCVSYFHTISKLFIFIRFIVPSPMSTLTGLDTLLYFPKLYHTLLYSVHMHAVQYI